MSEQKGQLWKKHVGPYTSIQMILFTSCAVCGIESDVSSHSNNDNKTVLDKVFQDLTSCDLRSGVYVTIMISVKTSMKL